MRTEETCACGQQHTVITEIVQGRKLPDALRALETWVSPGKAVLVVSDLTTRAVAGDEVAALLRGRGYRVEQAIIQSANPHTDEQAIAQVTAAGPRDYALLIAAGSGTVTDVTRMAAHRSARPFVSIPTAASMDGYSSPVVPMFIDGMKRAIPATPPIGVLVDLDLVATAPARMTLAGLGDLVGKLNARADWIMANLLTGEHICRRLADLSVTALETTLTDLPGLRAGQPRALGLLMQGLLDAGLAMQMAGHSRPASGAEHHLGHYWEEQAILNGTHADLHGTYVGVATPLAAAVAHRLSRLPQKEAELRLADSAVANVEPILDLRRWSEAAAALRDLVPDPETIRGLLRRAGAPATPGDLGLSARDIQACLIHAHEGRPRFTVLTLAHRLGVLAEWADRIAAES